MSVGWSLNDNYSHITINLQGFPWLQGTFRYTRSDDPRFNPNRTVDTLVDRGADLKFRLYEESKYMPALALGFQDVLGTGVFGSEYLVASKRYYDLDASFGLAWGYLGNRGLLNNPLTSFGSIFESRQETSGGTGGSVEIGRYFSGEFISPFAGIEYLTPIDGLRLKLEYDGNDYSSERGSSFRVDSPFNIGLDYSPWPWVSIGLAWERGNTLQTRVNLTSKLNEITGVPKLDPPPPALKPRPPAPNPSAPKPKATEALAAPQDTAGVLFDAFEDRDLEIEEIALNGMDVKVTLAANDGEPNRARLAMAASEAVRKLALPIENMSIAVRQTEGEQEVLRVAASDVYSAFDENGTEVNGSLHKTSEINGTTHSGSTADDGSPSDAGISMANAIFDGLEAEGFAVDAFDLTHSEAKVYLSQSKYRQTARAIGRAARIMANTVPAHIEKLTVVLLSAGVETIEVTILRKDLENAVAFEGSAEEVWHNASVRAPTGIGEDAVRNEDRYPSFSWFLAPRTRQHVGRPQNFFKFQIWAHLGAELEVMPGVIVEGSVGKNIWNNFDELSNQPGSSLPHVRSEIVRYLQEGENNLVSLTGHYLARPMEDVYTRLTLGYLEEMYAGVSGEILYRPFGTRWAVGLELNQVYQREFEQRFGLLEGEQAYDVLTGHLDLYYRWPIFDLTSIVSIGRYLAGDVGSTLWLSRTFDSGVEFGGWATFTDVSAQEFGEGSFDKGFFVSVPLELFFGTSSRARSTFPFRPLTRDGGQRINVAKRLYGLTEEADLGRFGDTWSNLLD